MNKKILIITIITLFVFGFLFMSCGEDEGEKTTDGGEKTTDGGEKTTDGGEKTTDGGEKTTDEGEKTTDEGEKTTDEGEKTTDGGEKTIDGGEKTTDEGEMVIGNKELELSYVLWDSEVASTNVVRAVLQERMGYEVKLTAVDAGVMWSSIAESDADGMVAAWLPGTHGHYLEKIKDEVVDLGPNLEGTRIGLVVPSYVTIDSIAELNEHADKFNGEITGIGPDAGIYKKTNEVIEEYGLTNFKQTQGTDATMTGTLADAIKNDEWVVVTGWTPHWKFAKFDLKYLEDPKNIYGGKEYIGTFVRKGLKEDMPEVYEFLDNFYWEPEDMAQVMIWNQEEGSDPYENAKRWIEENSDKVDKWIPESAK